MTKNKFKNCVFLSLLTACQGGNNLEHSAPPPVNAPVLATAPQLGGSTVVPEPSTSPTSDVQVIYEVVEHQLDERCYSGYASHVFNGEDANANGILEESEYAEEALVVCEHPKKAVCHGKGTLFVYSDGALKTHLDHGDKEGECSDDDRLSVPFKKER